MKKFSSIILALSLTAITFAQTPHLLKNIATGTISSTPIGFKKVGTELVFIASDTTHGTELWKTDGTSSGTVLLKDIIPGKSNSLIQWTASLNNDTLLFTVNDSILGTELWMTDGTTAGTHIVKDIWPGPMSSDPSYLVEMNGDVYFFANDSTHGNEFWKTDGTPAGTVFIKDINTSPTASSFAGALTRFNDTLLFSAMDGINGYELWRSDGTALGTYLLKDILPGGSSFPGVYRSLGNVCLFTADSTGVGNEPWVTNGTASGTYRLGDYYPGAGGSSFFFFTIMNGTIYGRGNVPTSGGGIEPWKTDGTVSGTQLLKDISNPGSSSPQGIFNVNNVLFIPAYISSTGYELWKSDGTTNGTVLLKEINPGISSSYPSNFTAFDGKVIFSADNGTNGKEIWITDTTTQGTKMLFDIFTGSAASNPNSYTLHNNNLLFAATDSNGTELWILPSCNNLDITLTGTNATSGPATGMITSSLTGGTAPFSYSWSSAQTTTTVTGLVAGNYILTVTDSNGCVTVDSVTIINTTGIGEVKNKLYAQVFSDYGNKQVRIVIDNFTPSFNYNVVLLNSIGQQVYKKTGVGKNIIIPTNTLSQGAYYINIFSTEEGGTLTQKIYIE